MTSTSDWAAKQKRLDGMPKPTATLTLYDDPAVRDRYQAAVKAADHAEEALAALPKDVHPSALALVQAQGYQAHAELQAATDERDLHTETLTFQALEREQLAELLLKHPPTEEDEEAGRDYHFDTFAPEVISAASMDGMPVEYAAKALKKWSLGDADDLWNVAWSVQRRKRTDLGKG